MQFYSSKLVSAAKMLQDAQKGRYAVGHFNINNLEWAKSLIEVAELTRTPIILGVSEGAIKYMGGYNTVVNLVNGLLEDLNVSIPVALHLDHGQSKASVMKAIKTGFSSVMFDGSHLPFGENLAITKEVVNYAHNHKVSVEAEIGSIGGEEDGVVADGELANPAEAKLITGLGIDVLAAGFGNIHGKYPANWKGLSFETLEIIKSTSPLPLVLHGGSGIPHEQVEKAISLGICKINVNTECQLAFAQAVKNYFATEQDLKDKGYDPRKILKPGSEAIKATFVELTKLFGCYGQIK